MFEFIKWKKYPDNAGMDTSNTTLWIGLQVGLGRISNFQEITLSAAILIENFIN